MLAKAKASMPIPAPGNKYSTTSLCYLLPTSGTVNDPEPPQYGKRGRRGSFGQLTFPFHLPHSFPSVGSKRFRKRAWRKRSRESLAKHGAWKR